MNKFIFCAVLSAALLVSYAFAAEPAKFDFGDAPDPAYPSLLQSSGARHKDTARVWLGGAVDAEADARMRDLDRGDDGLVSENPLTVRVTAAPLPAVQRAWYQRIFDVLLGRGRNRPYYINALIDRDNNGAWQSPAEWVVQNQRIVVPAGSSLGVRFKGVSGEDVRWDRTSEGWMRVTLTDVRIRNYDGTARNPFQVGETEDYAPTAEPPKEPQRAIWCFVDEKACRTLTKEEASEARDNKVELKGPYPDNASCVADCAKKTIETPTPVPKRGFPPEKPKERTIPTKSPATATCLGDNVAAHPIDGPTTCNKFDGGGLEYRCCAVAGTGGEAESVCYGRTPFEWSSPPYNDPNSALRCYGTPSANR